jgi:hypothetical protein
LPVIVTLLMFSAIAYSLLIVLFVHPGVWVRVGFASRLLTALLET